MTEWVATAARICTVRRHARVNGRKPIRTWQIGTFGMASTVLLIHTGGRDPHVAPKKTAAQPLVAATIEYAAGG